MLFPVEGNRLSTQSLVCVENLLFSFSQGQERFMTDICCNVNMKWHLPETNLSTTVPDHIGQSNYLLNYVMAKTSPAFCAARVEEKLD